MSVFKDIPDDAKVALCYTYSEAFPPLLNRFGKMGRNMLVYNNECEELEIKTKKLIVESEILIPNVRAKTTSIWKDVQGFAPDVVVFLNVDIDKNSTDADYYALCKNEFKNRVLPVESLIIFSGNYRGLIAGTAYAQIHPTLATRVHVISSIFYGSAQIFGDNEKAARVISKPNGETFVFGKVDAAGHNADEDKNLAKVDALRGIWAHDELYLLESEALINSIDSALSLGTLASCELSGRLPTEEEAKEYELPNDVMTWLPLNEEFEVDAKGYLKNTRSISAAIEEIVNEYKVPGLESDIDSDDSDQA